MPKVSINIISYNRSRYIKKALDSVLAQDFTDWEIIIIDDASTDDTALIINPYLTDRRIKYFRNEKNLGIGPSRNRALRESSGEFIAVLDSDDYWLFPDKLSRQISFLRDNAAVEVVGTSAVKIDKNDNKTGEIKVPTKDIKDHMLWKNPIIHSSVLYRRSAILSAGGYDGHTNVAEDYGLWLELGQRGQLANLPEQMIAYRIHTGNITSLQRRTMLARHILLLKKYREQYPGYYLAYLKRLLQYFLSFF